MASLCNTYQRISIHEETGRVALKKLTKAFLIIIRTTYLCEHTHTPSTITVPRATLKNLDARHTVARWAGPAQGSQPKIGIAPQG